MDYMMKAANLIYHEWVKLDYLILILIFSAIIFVFAKRKTYRAHSFNIRSSLNSINGYSRMMMMGRLGVLSASQKQYLEEIVSSVGLIKSAIAGIEKKRIGSADKEVSYDLRSALMSINGYCDLLLKSKPDLTLSQKECVGYIVNASRDIEHEVNS